MNMNKKQRGYNLVEIFIVLTVAAMMGSWLIANFYEYQKTQRVAETERTIESIKEGLVEYAAQNRAKDFTIIRSYENTLSITNTTLTVTVSWQMPAGRPYLPCPDITGDGIEDRVPLAVLANTLAVLVNNELDYSINSYSSVRPDECYAYKGMVPWRTIGAPSADFWGNHFTYRVDPEFANSLLGFDQETTSDDSGNQGVGSEPPLKLLTLSSGQIVAAHTQVRDPLVSFMTTASNANVSVAWGAGARVIEYHPSLICASSPCSFRTTLSLLAGEIATSSVTVATGSYRLDIPVVATLTVGNIINGVPVVILSHGENGYGAIIDDDDDDSQLICRDFPNTTPADYQDERENAQSRNVAAGGGCDAIPAHADSRLNGFVKREHAGLGSNIDDESQGFDDIVGWMSTEELRAKLVQQHVFPVEKLPPVGLEGY